MKMPLVSFILPVFNNNNSILPTIKSLISQDYQNKEIIIVDDSSTDNSIKLIQKYIDKYPFIKLISQPALGKINSIKVAISQVNGEFIMIAETGKIYIDTMTKYLIYNLEQENEIIGCDFFELAESDYYNLLEISKKSPKENLKTFSGSDYIQELTSSSNHVFENCITLWNKFIKKSLLKNIDFSEHTNTLTLAKSIFLNSKSIAISNQILICKILVDQYYIENCFNYKNLETIQFLEELLIDCKTENNKSRMYNCSLRLISYLYKIRKQLSFYSLNINDKIQLRQTIDKKFNSIYKFLIAKYPSKSENFEKINEQYRKLLKDERFRIKYYYLYPSYTEDYPEDLY